MFKYLPYLSSMYLYTVLNQSESIFLAKKEKKIVGNGKVNG